MTIDLSKFITRYLSPGSNRCPITDKSSAVIQSHEPLALYTKLKAVLSSQ